MSKANTANTDQTIKTAQPVSKTQMEKVDLRTKSTRKYELQFPEFYFSSSLDGWFCKTCTNFASSSGKKRPFIEIPGGFGDHPSDRTALHLNSNRHKESVPNKQAFNELREKNSDVYKLLVDASLGNVTAMLSQNRFVIKTFFRVAHFMILKNWACTHNFKDMVQLISDCR